MHASQNDAVKLIRTRFGRANTTATAGGSGDNTQNDAAWIDRHDFYSLKVVVNWTTTLAATETLSLAAVFRDATSDAGAGAASYGPTVASTVVATGPAGGGTVTGTTEFDLDLAAAKAFVQARITPDLSRGATDTAAYSVVYVLAGGVNNPVSQSAV
jgi:hypothetical protein